MFKGAAKQRFISFLFQTFPIRTIFIDQIIFVNAVIKLAGILINIFCRITALIDFIIEHPYLLFPVNRLCCVICHSKQRTLADSRNFGAKHLTQKAHFPVYRIQRIGLTNKNRIFTVESNKFVKSPVSILGSAGQTAGV